MILLESLATELLLAIARYLDSADEFPTAHDYSDGDSPPPLKSLAVCSRRFYAICSPILFESLRLRLAAGSTVSEIDRLRKFLAKYGIQVDRIAVDLGPEWNEGKVGITLKQFLSDIHVRTLSLEQRGSDVTHIREKSARWLHFLNDLEQLRLETVEDENDLKMLLLRQCPIGHLRVEDGKTSDSSWTMSNSYRAGKPAVAFLKPSLFPRLRRVEYTSIWPSARRFTEFLRFASMLPELRYLAVTLMEGVVKRFRHEDVWFRQTEEGLRYRTMVSAYKILSTEVESWEKLETLVIGDFPILVNIGDFTHPKSYGTNVPGTYKKLGTL